MSRIPPPSHQKRKLDEGVRGKTNRHKTAKRQRIEDYHSSSDESEAETRFAPVNLADSDDEAPINRTPIGESPVKTKVPKSKPVKPVRDEADSTGASSADASTTDGEGSDDDEEHTSKPKHKRNDPDAFATSISKILSTKLPQSVRQDPVLSRSKSAAETSTSIANERLERKAKAKMRAEKIAELERGRVKDVLGIESGRTGEVAEEEKRLKKIAQRGVVALFNAFRAAQTRGEQTAKDEQKKGTVGISNREEKVKEMSKQGFLDLINGQKKRTAG
jgi:hypothetical protein